MENHRVKYSLLPYLNPVGNNFYLKLSLSEEDPGVLSKTRFPFLLIDDSGPLSRLVEGKLMSDAGSEVKRFFLLVQKDQYLFPQEELSPLDNRGVDQLWQKAFTFYADRKEDFFFTFFSRQVDEERKLSPFGPVFYCKNRRIFFPPACPQCGAPLELCIDDDLLTGSGLQPYSTTLKRYLFCPACAPKGRTDFYVHDLGNLDSPDVKDWQTLVRDFALLVRSGKTEAPIPCFECQAGKTCYGPGLQVMTAIVPFSFYPFYMLVLEAPCVNGADFLSLLSGATYAELEDQLKARKEFGRIRCLKDIQKRGLTKPVLFSEKDERSYWEVLYLKLSLLSELVDAFLVRDETDHDPSLSVSIERIWIDLVPVNSRLPVYWNFKLKFIDTIRPPLRPLFFPNRPSFWRAYFLGLLWFRVLLVNKSQDLSTVYHSMEKIGPRLLSVNFPVEHFVTEVNDPTFFSVNIFWNPEAYELAETDPLWERALSLGLSLLKRGYCNDPQWSREGFLQGLENLREEVKLRIFQEGPAAGEKIDLRDGTDQAIYDLLISVINKRKAESRADQEGLEKTVLLRQAGGEREDLLEETVLLSPKAKGEGGPPVGQKRLEDSLPETLISPLEKRGSGQEKDRSNQRSTLPEEQTYGDEFVSETIILKPVKSARISSDQAEDPGRSGAPAKRAPEDDSLSETVVIAPGKKSKHGNK